MKIVLVLSFLFLVNGLCAQIINSQASILHGKKYFVDNNRLSKKEFIRMISEDRKAGELYIKSRNAKRKGSLLNVVQIIGSLASLYQISRWNLPAAYKILAGTYLLGLSSLYFTEISENKFREAILEYNQGLLSSVGEK